MTNNNNTTIYTGVTSNLTKRVYDHKQLSIKGFTQKYKLVKLVYYEVFNDISEAILREKQIKAGSRAKKEALIQQLNPTWKDLYYEIV